MAAAATDLLRKLSRRWVGQIGSGGVSDETTTTVPLASATNLATDTAVTVVIDRVDANGTATPSAEETVVGVVSGSNLVSCIRGVEGTAQAHDAGAVVEVLVTADGYNDVIDHLLVEHTQLGAHKPTQIVDTNGNEVVKFGATASAVNEITITNKDTASSPVISATGGDDNVGIVLTPKGTGKVSVSANDFSIATGANIQVNATDPKRAFYIPASGMFGATTNGAASGQGESSSNKVNYKTLDFDKATDEYACFSIPAPLYWDLGTVTAQFFWTAAAGSASETVQWMCQGISLSNDDAIDQAYGTAVGASDALIATGDVHVTAATEVITLAGTPAAGDQVFFRIYRDISEDNLDADARLIGVRIEFGISKYNDIA